ncbi:MAG: MFS transporter [Candidatus Lokiarchaeota archaeon]|nr:MFS transporter [Candidatus Lokiarchaeota archaeon]
MTEINNNNQSTRSKSYFRYLIFVLMLVQILDTYSTLYPGSIPSLIVGEFFPGVPDDITSSIVTLAGSIISIGMYFLFFNQYLVDKIGRKRMLAITILGMSIASIGMFLSVNYVMYVAFQFFLYFFFMSDIWLIYANEESKQNKRALNTNIILMAGLLGAIIMVIFRFIFVTDINPYWRGMTLFPIIFGIPLSIVIYFTLKETTEFQSMKKATEGVSRSFVRDIKSVFQIENKKSFIYILVISFLFGFSNLFIGLFEKYITDVGSIPQSQVNILFFLTIFTVMIAYLTNGFLADRIGRKPLLYLWSLLLPFSVIVWVWGAYNPSNAFLIVLIGYAISHISYWGLWGIIRIIALELMPTDRRGTGIGVRSLIGAVGITTGLLMSSFIVLELGLGMTFIIFVLGNFLIIPLGGIFVKETKGVDLAEIK